MTDVGPLLQIRKRQRQRRRVRLGVAAGAIVVVLAVLTWVVVFSSVFAVRQVTVEGATIVSADDVCAAAAVQIGQPLLRVDGGAVADRVTAALPEIASVTISRNLPGTLVIRVNERSLVFQVPSQGQYEWVSADGVGFHVSPDAQPVPVVDAPLDDAALLRDVATVVQALPADLASHVVSMSAKTRDSIALSLDGGRQVVWGSADQSDLKAQVIVPLLNVPGKVYDISAPSNPAVR